MTSTISILNQQLSFEKINSLDNYKDNLYPEKLVFEKMVNKCGIFEQILSLNKYNIVDCKYGIVECGDYNFAVPVPINYSNQKYVFQVNPNTLFTYDWHEAVIFSHIFTTVICGNNKIATDFIYKQIIDFKDGSNCVYPSKYVTLAHKFRNSQEINDDFLKCETTKQIAENALFAIKQFDGVDNFVNVVNV
jgi:hypothetical protein